MIIGPLRGRFGSDTGLFVSLSASPPRVPLKRRVHLKHGPPGLPRPPNQHCADVYSRANQWAAVCGFPGSHQPLLLGFCFFFFIGEWFRRVRHAVRARVTSPQLAGLNLRARREATAIDHSGIVHMGRIVSLSWPHCKIPSLVSNVTASNLTLAFLY